MITYRDELVDLVLRELPYSDIPTRADAERIIDLVAVALNDDLTAEQKQIADTASIVYCEITGGQMSYPTYAAQDILVVARDYTQRLVDEETDDLRAEVERLTGQ